MSSVAAQAPATTRVRAPSNQPPLWLVVMPIALLFAVSTFLFWLSKGGTAGVFGYWELLIPLVAVMSLFSGWGQAYLSDRAGVLYLVRQVLHWGLLIALLYVINTQGIRPLLNDTQYTIVLLYLFGCMTLLAAVHLDIKLLFFGVFLVFCGFLIAVPTDNPTLVSIGQTFNIADAQNSPVAVTIGMAVIGCIATLFLLFIVRGAVLSKHVGEKRKAAAS